MFSNQKGALPLLVLVAAVGLISLVAVTTTVQFNDQFFSNLFPKPGSFASAPVTPAPTPIVLENLLKNPGCEINTQYWAANNSTITRITNPEHVHSGTGSCRASRSAGTTYGIQETVAASKRVLKNGEKYIASVWVKGNSSTIGKNLIVRLRQAGGTTAANNANASVKLTGGWQLVSVRTTINAPDRTDLRVMVLQQGAIVGNAFVIDDASLTLEPVPQTPAPSPSLMPDNGVKFSAWPAAGADSTINPNCPFSVDVNLNTNGFSTAGSDAILKFEPSKVYVTSIVPSSMYPNYPVKSYDNSTGVITISGVSGVDSDVVGNGTFATVNLKVRQGTPPGTTALIFDFDPFNPLKTTDSNVVDSQTLKDLLRSTANPSFVIGSTACQ